ncbi:MAG: nucleotidyltransferase domain-containing protein [Cyanobium sp. PLM2.Bin73]|jgi:predicted nucleotidyltransferase|nr:MAG: nucleotidyltransferase domain-containing protein [Cyanobium sp. PLM2.Bin73]
MATATQPWTHPQPLPARVELGPGLEPERLTAALRRLCTVPGVQAVVAFGSRGRGDAHSESDLDLAVICAEPQLPPHTKLERWRQCRQALGLLGRDVDLVVQGQADAERLAGSRWHVMGDVAREGRVLYVAG